VVVAAKAGIGLETFIQEAFLVLDRIRVYSKAQGKKPDMESPFVLSKGTTVIEMAREIHKDFVTGLRAARIYSEDKYNGQRVGKDFILRDGDIIEIVV